MSKAIADAFHQAAKSSGSVGSSEFKQKKLFVHTEDPSVRKGLCGGLSLCFLGAYATDGLQGLAKTLDADSLTLFNAAKGIQDQLMSNPGKGISTLGGAFQANFSKAAPKVGLQSDGRLATMHWPCADKLGQSIANRAASYVIALGTHYVAVAFDGKTSAVFDANAGAAAFDGWNSLCAMLVRYFTVPLITESYGCSGTDAYLLSFAAR